MAELIAIGYDQEATAARAAEELERQAELAAVEPDAVAVIVRDGDGTFRVTTSHHPVSAEATWGMLWGTLFGLVFFRPVFGMSVGRGLGALIGKIEGMGIDPAFQEGARGLLQPGMSALFIVVEGGEPAAALDGLSSYGGRALATSLSDAGRSELQAYLHGDSAPRSRLPHR